LAVDTDVALMVDVDVADVAVAVLALEKELVEVLAELLVGPGGVVVSLLVAVGIDFVGCR